VSKLKYDVRPGGLAEEDHQRIFDLAARGWKPTRIAREIEKHPATVYWFMIRNSLATPGATKFKTYIRNGKPVVPYSPEEDAFIVALRVQDYSLAEIARLAASRFGTNRKMHSVQVRLIMLAARDEAA